MKRIVFRSSPNLIREVSTKLYRDLIEAVLELVLNGVDAATVRNTIPNIQIRFWNKDAHPLVAGSRGLSITDNGTGFTDEVVEAYGLFGESVHINHANMHGTHGLGKFAALALSEEDRDDFLVIVTDPGDGEGIREYRFSLATIFGQDGFTPKKVKPSQYPNLPPAPFSMLFIPAVTAGLNKDTLGGELANMLPMRSMDVSVDEVLVPKRTFVAQSTLTTPDIAHVGPVSFQFAVTKSVSTRDEGVMLVDADTGRRVCELHTLSPTVRRKISPWVMHPRLTGFIKARGLEKLSSAGRSGLDIHFWNLQKGVRLLEAINVFGERLARGLVEETGVESADSMKATLREIQLMFWGAFGKPETFIPGRDQQTKAKEPVKGDGSTHDYPDKRKPTTPTGHGHKQERWSAAIGIEGKHYGVLTFPSDGSKTPAYVIRDRIIIDTDHPEIKRLMKLSAKNQRLLMEGIIQAMIEAHVAATRDVASTLFVDVYRLKAMLFSEKKK